MSWYIRYYWRGEAHRAAHDFDTREEAVARCREWQRGGWRAEVVPTVSSEAEADAMALDYDGSCQEAAEHARTQAAERAWEHEMVDELEPSMEPDEETMETWAEHYDDLNGAPEGDWDR